MEYGAIDLHKKESQVRIITETSEVIDRRISFLKSVGLRLGVYGGPSTSS